VLLSNVNLVYMLQMDAGNQATLNGLFRWGASLRGTQGYWKSQQVRGYAFVDFLEYFYDSLPTVFNTISAAELHWEWLHRLMPESEQYLGREDLSQKEEYRLRSEAVVNNPALLAWGFHEMVTRWLLKVMYPHADWGDHLGRCERLLYETPTVIM
jgi:hypothetical protein